MDLREGNSCVANGMADGVIAVLLMEWRMANSCVATGITWLIYY